MKTLDGSDLQVSVLDLRKLSSWLSIVPKHGKTAPSLVDTWPFEAGMTKPVILSPRLDLHLEWHE